MKVPVRILSVLFTFIDLKVVAMTDTDEATATIKPSRFGLGHAIVFAVLWFCFTVLTYAAVSGGLTNASQEQGLVILTTIGTITGPMTGAICREFQSCCLRVSLILLPYAAGGLMGGIAFQWLPLPRRSGWQVLRLGAWGLGWLVWFGSGILSFVHALS